MIYKSQKVVVGVTIAGLIVCSFAALMFARMYYNLAPMVINDSSPGFAAKLSDEERTHIDTVVRSLLFQVAVVLFILAGLWAAFAGVITWLWSRSSRKSLDHETRVA